VKERIRVAQVKVVPKKGALQENCDLLLNVLARIAPESPDVVVTGEGFLDGYIAVEESVGKERLREYAIEPQSSPYSLAAAEWARGNRSWLIFGCSRRDGAEVFNSALIYDREGRLAGIYDKVQLQTHDLKYSPGRSLPVFASDFGPFGVLICADRRWPETVRTLALRGARIIFNPTYGMNNDLNLCMMRTRSSESEVFIAFTHPKQALITDPLGKVICNEEHEEVTFVVSELDLAKVSEVRGRPAAHLKDRRPELYSL